MFEGQGLAGVGGFRVCGFGIWDLKLSAVAVQAYACRVQLVFWLLQALSVALGLELTWAVILWATAVLCSAMKCYFR